MRRATLARLALGAMLASTAAVLAAPAGALAAPPDCDQVVVDQAGKLGDTGSVSTAASKLTGLGADVRVRVYASIPTSTLDQYEAQVQQGCPSWQSASGGRKANLLVFMVSYNPNKVAIYGGDQWASALGSQTGRIQGQVMTPQLRASHNSQAFVDGMNEAYRVIDAYEHPQQGNHGSGTTVVNNNKPANLTGLWVVLGGIVALLALGLIGFLIWRWNRDRVAGNRARDTARQKAIRAKQSAASAINNLDATRLTVLKAKCGKYGIAGYPLGDQLRTAYGQLQPNLDAATAAFANLGTGANDPQREGFTASTYEEIASQYEEIGQYANAALTAAAEVERLVQQIEASIANLDGDLRTESAAISALRGTATQLQAAGFTIDDQMSALGEADENLSTARANDADLQSVRLLATATTLRKQVETAISELVELRDSVANGIAQAEADIATAKTKGADALAAFRRIKSGNPSHAWESIQGNGTEAGKRISVAEATATEMRRLSGEAHQWAEAAALLGDLETTIQQALSLLDAVTSLENHLNEARDQAPREIADAQADLAKAREYERTHDDDIGDGVKDDLREAERLLDQAQQEAQADLPDWLRVVELALQANHMADDILAGCMGEVEAAERLRKQADSALSQAQAAASKAARYIDNHDSDVDDEARRLLRKAQGNLDAAMAASNRASVLDLAKKAKNQANVAYDEAKADFDVAENRRRPRYNNGGYSGGYSGGYGGGSNNDLLTGVLIGEAASGWGSRDSSTTNVYVDNSSNYSAPDTSSSFDSGGGDGFAPDTSSSFDSGGGGGFGSDSGF